MTQTSWIAFAAQRCGCPRGQRFLDDPSRSGSGSDALPLAEATAAAAEEVLANVRAAQAPIPQLAQTNPRQRMGNVERLVQPGRLVYLAGGLAVVLKAMDRAREKYGGEQDWSHWQFRAEPIPACLGAKPVHFEWREGRLTRTE